MKQGLLTDVEIQFRYALGQYNAKEKALPIAEAFELCKSITEKFPEVEPLQKWWNSNNTLEKFGYMSSSGGEYSFHLNTYLPIEKGTEFHTCPRGAEVFGPLADRAKESTWDKIGEDRVCSYCGSLHPEDFEKIVDLCIESNGEKAEIDLSDKGYKIYARRKETVNASQGGIKFYTMHIGVIEEPQKSEYITRVEPKINQAAKISWERSTAAWNKINGH